jgi:predicted RNase H-like nuclease (RuvC/YqgF family)
VTNRRYEPTDMYKMLQQEIMHLELEIAMKTKHLIALHKKAETIRIMHNLDIRGETANVAKAFNINGLQRTT